MEFWDEKLSKRPTIMIHRTLRSGQNLHYDGNVVIMGDVNPGAEVVASGHVLVMGALRGLVHAGATGEEEATVIALSLAPTQLRIASHITRPPDNTEEEGELSKLPEIARIKNDAVIIEEYQPQR